MGHPPEDPGGLINITRPLTQPVLVDHVDEGLRFGEENFQQVARFAPGHKVWEDFAQFFGRAVPHDQLREGIGWDADHPGPILEAKRVDRRDPSVFEDHIKRLAI